MLPAVLSAACAALSSKLRFFWQIPPLPHSLPHGKDGGARLSPPSSLHVWGRAAAAVKASTKPSWLPGLSVVTAEETGASSAPGLAR